MRGSPFVDIHRVVPSFVRHEECGPGLLDLNILRFGVIQKKLAMLWCPKGFVAGYGPNQDFELMYQISFSVHLPFPANPSKMAMRHSNGN
jgi:hypothetical protein